MIFLLVVLVATSSSAISFRNVCVQDAPVLTFYGLTFFACKEKCGRTAACQNFVYTRRSFRCKLYGSVSNLEECAGNVYASTASNMLPDSGLQYCPTMAEESNTVVLGNMNKVGAKRKVDCLPQYALEGANYIHCLQNGSWLEPGSCIKTCSNPGPVQNLLYTKLISRDGETVDYPDTATMDSFLFASGSSVMVACSTGALVGSSTVYCQASGAWGTFPVCTTMRISCSSPSDCADTDSECRNGQCWCNPGLSYSRSEAACVGQCQTYGNTFQEVPNYVIGGNDDAAKTITIYTTTGCRDYCASDPMCYSVDFRYFYRCYVNTRLPYQVNTSFFPDIAFHYFQRDCA